MEYHVKRIRKKEEIAKCERFSVDNFQWVDGPKPQTWGYMGYLEGQGLYVEMYCEEKNPRCMCTDRFSKEMGSRVCDDSAMEAFVGFLDETGKMSSGSMYVNFEINADGVMYANFGKGRKGRSFLSDEMYEMASPKGEILGDAWKISVLFPEGFLREIGGSEIGKSGTEFYCNFYKISETPEMEHYASFAKIGSETPNFHLPEYFAKAIVE